MTDYGPLEEEMKSTIHGLASGEEFTIADILSNPPARLGRTLYEEVQSGEIPNVQYLGRINRKSRYRKL